ncbi:MAG TPA: glycosyltransferase [Herpetosiphonaceae bacterium]
MRILLMSFGSMGDVVPFAALAQALRRRGHQPVLAVPTHIARHLERYKVPIVPLGPDLGAQFQVAQTQLIEGRFTQDDVDRGHRLIAAIGPQVLRTLAPLVMSSDVLVSLYGMPFVDVLHRSTNIPTVSLRIVYPGHEKPGPDSDKRATAHGVVSFQPVLNLYALSRTIFDPPDLPAHHHVVGFFFFEDDGFMPSPELSAFMQRGPAPIVFSMGSMIHSDPVRLTAMFRDVTERIGCRGIIQSGWSGLGHDLALPETIFAAEYVPYRWLFQRAACVVHPGSAGTTAWSLWSDAPMVLIPHILDHFPIAQRAAQHGSVGGIIPYQELTIEALESALRKTIDNAQMRSAAQAVGKIVRSEGGLEAACDLIETLPPRSRTTL